MRNGKKRFMTIIVACVVLVAVAIVAIVAINRGAGQEKRQIAENLDLGNNFLVEQNYEEAIVAFNKALEIDPKNEDAYLGLAKAYLSLIAQKSTDSEDTTEGIRLCETVLDILEKGFELTQSSEIETEIEKITEVRENLENGYISEDVLNPKDEASLNENGLNEESLDALASEESSAKDNASENSSDDNSGISSASLDDIVSFGIYEGNPIEWCVIDKSDGKMLLLSQNSLGVRCFDQSGAVSGRPKMHRELASEGVWDWSDYDSHEYLGTSHDTNWEVSEIRAWLNNELINVIFNADEQKQIMEISISNDRPEAFLATVATGDPRACNSTSCNDTNDRLFLLSVEEYQEYVDMIPESDSLWWLRSEGYYGDQALYVGKGGTLSIGAEVFIMESVRPAMYVKY